LGRWRSHSRRWVAREDSYLDAETIQSRVPIWMVVGLYAPEVPVSGRRPMRCPFHDDRVASATIDNNEGWFRCHACEIKGDIFSLVRRVENFSEYTQARDFIVRRLL
jgi:DNA primase